MENYLKYKIRKSLSSDQDLIYRSDNKSCIDQIVDLREWDSIVESQGTLSSCTSSAITSAYELMLNQFGSEFYYELSDLFIYYNSRLEEGTIDQDVGIFLKTGMMVLKKYGVCLESLWPYDLSKWNSKPSDESYADAEKRKILKYQKVISTYYITEVLSNNKPVVFGMEIYESFMELNNRISTVSFPSRKEKSLGGHAMCMVGYDLEKRLFLAKNSFGIAWGMDGYCWIPFDYLKQEGYDAWIFDIPNSNTIGD